MYESVFDARLDMLNTEVRMLNFIKADSFKRNCKAHIANAIEMIEPTPEVRKMAKAVLRASHELAATVSITAPMPKAEAMQALLDLTNQLRDEMRRCKPSSTARALGLG